MEDIRKLSFSVSPELEKQIVDMRKRDEYCRLTVAEIIRRLVQAGLEALASEPQS